MEEIAIDDPTANKNVHLWLEGGYDEVTKEEIRRLLKNNPQEIIDSFYKTLTFGTGGMRGVMGVGTNRMNFYSVRSATQGLANYLLKQKSQEETHHVLIGYDSRHHSKEFAEEAAKVLAANGIYVYLLMDLRPTPLVSFGCRFKKCTAAIMITASHNPPEYNGYKVYWSDGGQVVPPHDVGIVEEVQKITDLSQVKHLETLDSPLIELIEDEVDDAYLESIFTLQLYPKENKREGHKLQIVYTSLHGTGITLAPRALRMWGFTDLIFVDPQIIPNGDFPTAHYPNPEIPEALSLGIKVLTETKRDLLIATDPDADRMGVVVFHDNRSIILNGNQIACIMIEHICEALEKQGKLNDKTAFVKSIVTSELFKKIADSYQTHSFDVLTGFKYIAEKIHEWEESPDGLHFTFGAEESLGTLFGSFSRDKDAVLASALISEVALKLKLEGKTLVDFLNGIYAKHGIYTTNLISINYEESKEGQQEMKEAMDVLRKTPLNEIAGTAVSSIDDYLTSKKHILENDTVSSLSIPQTDMLIYWLSDGTKLMVRPSGTEPKVKIYCEVINKDFASVDEGEKQASELANRYLSFVKGILKKT